MNNLTIRVSLAILILLFLSPVVPGKEIEELPKGKLIEKVSCTASPAQSYALFLPPGYNSEKKWPIIYCFDPAARGSIAAAVFQEAAERYGYIIAASNNSQNGDIQLAADAAKAMIEDTNTKFSLDEQRVYISGFSGGARIAIQFARLLKPIAAAVITCGAGLPFEMNGAPPPELSYFLVAGNDDFNFGELRELNKRLAESGGTKHFTTFAGGHSWPPTAIGTQAIVWLELQAIKSGKRSKDEHLIDELFQQSLAAARAEEQAGLLLPAMESYQQLAVDFKTLKDVGEFEKKAASLSESKEVKKAQKQEQEDLEEQRKRLGELFALRTQLAKGSKEISEPERPSGQENPRANPNLDPAELGGSSATSNLRSMLANLKKRADAKDPSAGRAVARRILNNFLVISYERTGELFRNQRYDQAAATLEIDAAILPEPGPVLYRLACAQALNGNKKKALEALKKATRSGFTDLAEIEQNHALDSLRGESDYKKIIENIGKR